MTPDAVTLAVQANLPWGNARERLGRVRKHVEADPNETNRTAESDALTAERHAWRTWQAALVEANFGPMPDNELAD
jgi:hypothetical protein